MRKYTLYELVDGYYKPEGGEGKKFVSKSFTGSFSGKHGGRYARLMLAVTSKLKALLSFTSARFYGLVLLSFGLVTLFVHLIKDYLGLYEVGPLGVLITGAVSAMLGVLLVVSDKPLCIFLQDFVLTDYVFFEFFCIKRTNRLDGTRGIPSWVGLILGSAIAALAAVLPFFAVVISAVAAVYVFVSFVSPEFSLFSTFLVLPYLSMLDNHELILSAFVGVNILSFVRKVALGKRVYTFEQYDVYLGIFLLFVLISGIFVKGIESFTNSLVMIVLAMGYVLSGSIIANRRLADCLINALIFSSVPVSCVAVVQFVIGLTEAPLWQFSGVSATFSSPSVLAVFLLSAFIFTLYFTSARRRRSAKLVYIFISALTLFALVLTLSPWATTVAALVLIGFALTAKTRVFGIYTILFALLPSLFIFLPGTALLELARLPVLSFFSLDALATRWNYARQMFFDNALAGIGIGESCFVLELEALGVAEPLFPNGGTFFLEVALEAGVFALAALLLIFVTRVRHTAIYIPYVKTSQVSTLSKFTSLALAALIALGAFNYLWADMSMFFLFWCIFGVGSATLRISKGEHDDRVAYYSDGRSADSSAIDIGIR
ncbi:MAG: hypothetical protein IJW48_05685 [Clostridia bacterium]|nr:hypothetical protein [Clostridia bacterium]